MSHSGDPVLSVCNHGDRRDTKPTKIGSDGMLRPRTHMENHPPVIKVGPNWSSPRIRCASAIEHLFQGKGDFVTFIGCSLASHSSAESSGVCEGAAPSEVV